jgi:hypothetical protein
MQAHASSCTCTNRARRPVICPRPRPRTVCALTRAGAREGPWTWTIGSSARTSGAGVWLRAQAREGSVRADGRGVVPSCAMARPVRASARVRARLCRLAQPAEPGKRDGTSQRSWRRLEVVRSGGGHVLTISAHDLTVGWVSLVGLPTLWVIVSLSQVCLRLARLHV